MHNVRSLPLFILVLLTSFVALAQQPTQVARTQLEFDLFKTEATVIANPDSSLLLFARTAGSWSAPTTYEVTRYNHNLQATWVKQVTLDPLSEFLTYFSEPPYTYLALTDKGSYAYQFLKIDNRTGTLSKHDYKLEDVDSLYMFKVIDDNYFVVARNRKSPTPLLLHISQETGDVRPLPAAYGNESTFADVLAHPNEEQFSVVLSESNGKITRLQTKLFGADGSILQNYFIQPQHDKNLLTAEITPGDTTNRLLIGNYASRSLSYSSGFFTTPLAGTPDDLRFYSFMQLKNFFKYMKPKREERVRKREISRIKSGKDSGLKFRMLLHDVLPTQTGYILTAELYNFDARNNNFNRLYSSTGYLIRAPRVYRRTQAIALSFDKNGVLLWDNSFPLLQMESQELKPTVEVAHSPSGKIVIAYPEKDMIYYKVMEQDVYQDDHKELQLQATHPTDKILSTNLADLMTWYGLNYAAFGWHRIKTPGSESRTVFYISRVSFE